MKNSSKVIFLIVGIAFIITGILALADIFEIPQIIGIILGAAALIQGLRVIWIYVRTEEKSGFKPSLFLVWGILLLLLSVFLFISPKLASTIAIYLVGAWFVADAVSAFFTLRLLDTTTKKVSIILSILILAGCFILIFHQPLGIEILTIPIAITLILDGFSMALLAMLRQDPAKEKDPLVNGEEPPRLSGGI